MNSTSTHANAICSDFRTRGSRLGTTRAAAQQHASSAAAVAARAFSIHLRIMANPPYARPRARGQRSSRQGAVLDVEAAMCDFTQQRGSGGERRREESKKKTKTLYPPGKGGERLEVVSR